jgi:hypothetical protein
MANSSTKAKQSHGARRNLDKLNIDTKPLSPFISKLRRVSKDLLPWLCWSSKGITMFASNPTFKLAKDGHEPKGMLMETKAFKE